MAVPTVKVEIAFSTQPDDPSPVWVDVTGYTRCVTDPISITRGRQDRYETVQPSKLSLTLLNIDGRFTPGNISSPYYPNVKKGRKIRVSVIDNGVTYRRFTGFIDEWPVTWADASASVSDVRISASSRMARLGRGKVLPSLIELEYLLDDPIAYYPLSDSEGATSAGNVSTDVMPQMAVTPFGGGSNANITFGSATGPSTASLTSALFTRVSSTAGAYLLMSSPTLLVDGQNQGTVLLEAFFKASAAQEMGICQADQFGFFPGQTAYYLGTNASGKLIGVNQGVGGPIYTLTSAATVSDGATHHIALREQYNGTNTIADLFLDGVNVGTTTIGGAWNNSVYRLLGGGGLVNSAFAGTLSHVALTWSASTINTARILQHALAGTTGFSGESSGSRLFRLSTYAGVPDIDTEFDAGLSTSMVSQDTSGQVPITLMQDVVATEGGVLFDAGGGDLTFHDRAHRYNAASVLTLSGNRLQPTLEPRLDDQNLVNDVTASRPGGVSLRAVDLASVAEYGTYREDISLLTTSDNEVFDAANWRLYTGSTPQVSVPTAETELADATTAQKAAVLARDVSDRITLSTLPAQAPASSMDFFVEGLTETIYADSYRIVFNLSSASLSGVWQLDSPVYSVLGSTTRSAY
jgi:hypothetical protein